MLQKKLFWLIVLGVLKTASLSAQFMPDHIYDSAIHAVRVHPARAPLAMPVITLNEPTVLKISFDDFSADYQEYTYSFELMNADWTAVDINSFDYLQGFNQQKIYDYQVSSISTQHYFHYSFSFPNANCKPKISGNYLLKVFKNGDPQALIFTHRIYVVDNIVPITAKVHEPFDGNLSRTHQKIQVIADIKKIPFFQPNEIKVQVVQNFNFDDAQWVTVPNFIRDNELEYFKEGQFVFPAGKEARWLDIRNFRLVSDRISKFEQVGGRTNVFVKPDVSRVQLPYYTFNDLNGNFIISNTESLESDFQNDYALVHFTYMPPTRLPYVGQNLYLQGALTNNRLDQNAIMHFNAKLGLYQKTLLLKQGYYSYYYVLRDPSLLQSQEESDISTEDYTETEGNHWETENSYSIFIYYRLPGGRHDQILGFAVIDSKDSW